MVDTKESQGYHESSGDRPVNRLKPVRLEGKPGNWIALAGRPRRVVAEAKTLRAVARKAEEKGHRHPTFARVPKSSTSLVL